MNKKTVLILFVVLIFSLSGFISLTSKYSEDGDILSYAVDLSNQDLKFYWKDDEWNILKSIQNLKTYVESKNLSLVFAMNGGMYKEGYSPHGLFIQEKKMLSPLDTARGNGNFYLEPNGVFYITTFN